MWKPVRVLPLVESASLRQQQEEISISRIKKDALVFSSPGSVELSELTIGPGTALMFDYGIPEKRGRRNTAAVFRVKLVSGSGTLQRIVTVFEETLSRSRKTPPEWKFASVDLPVEKRQPHRIILEVEASKGRSFAGGAWSDVVIAPPLPTREPRKNLILITLDTTRADHLSLYGYEQNTTPFLQELGRRSTLFTRAYTASTWTLPSHATIFTGLFPGEHQAIALADMKGGSPLDDTHLTLAEVLLREGFFTMGIAGGGFLRRPFNLSQGFLYYSDRWEGLGRSAAEANRVALDWLNRIDDRPFFLFINYFDPHAPYDPPGFVAKDKRLFQEVGINIRTFQPIALKKKGIRSLPQDVVAAMVRRYDDEILTVDRAIREIVNALREKDLLEQTLICIAGDHGESFGEQALWGHGGPFFDSQARVPLLVFDPAEAGSAVHSPVSTILIPHMIFSRMGLATPPSFRTESPVYGSRFTPPGSMRFLVKWPYKYLVHFDIRKPDAWGTVFDLDTDPGETSGMDPARDRKFSRMRQQFSEFISRIEAPPGLRAIADAERSPAAKDEELKKQLKALGYLN